MGEVVAVHGIAQQQLGPHQLLESWRPALQDGLSFAADRAVPVPPLTIAFYGHLFLPRRTDRTVPGATVKGGDGDADLLEDLQGSEVEFLAAVAGEVLGAQAAQDAVAGGEAAEVKGIRGVPVPVARLIGGLDRWWGTGSAGVLFISELRQVRRYLRDAQLKAAIDAAVDRAVAECRLLIGHSLGSVVALEYVRRHPEHHLDLLLTLGSPLASRLVRGLLPEPGFAAGRLPDSVAAWVNVRDPQDPVAACGDLATIWAGVVDVPVENDRQAHAAVRYLSKQETGAAILDALPHLAGDTHATGDGAARPPDTAPGRPVMPSPGSKGAGAP